jgi:orotate phosphoribosyltransferase
MRNSSALPCTPGGRILEDGELRGGIVNGFNFTFRVRNVLAMAREESTRLRHEYVGTEHILLGLLREPEGAAATVLRAHSVDREAVKHTIDRTVKTGTAARSLGRDIPYTSRARKVIELSMQQSRELGDSYIGTEHLLLGLLAERDGLGAQVLRDAGLTLEAARSEVHALNGEELDSEHHRPDANTAGAFLELVAGRHGHFQLESGHHSRLWLDLDPLFSSSRVDPFVASLARALRPHQVDVVCGPLVGGAFLAQLVARKLGVEFCFTERVPLPDTVILFQARYRLPSAFASRVAAKRCAIVDDVMSAGSALRGTYAELRLHGARPVVAGALLKLGETGAQFFAQEGVPVEAVAREPYELWLPEDCPLCTDGLPLLRLS